MALATGAGTETIHSHMFTNVDATQTLIYGVQHHIYTVLSIVVYCHVLNATSDSLKCLFSGYDSKGGTAQQGHTIFNQSVQVGETFVWNDKFSFNGCGPGSNTQAARAAQDGAVQSLNVVSTNSGFIADITCTFIDQNNAV